MFKLIHQLLNPHCEHCLAERREQREELKDNKVCLSCETLQRQLEIKNHECEQLLAKLLREPEAPAPQTAPMITSKPRTVPWAVRRQMLEGEDRKKAQLLRAAPKPSTNLAPQVEDVADLERELDVVAKEREASNV